MTHAPHFSTEELDQVRWKGREFFRCLGYYFSARWNRALLGKVVDHVLGGFRVPEDYYEPRNPPTPGLPHEYSLVYFGPSDDPKGRYKLLYGNYLIHESSDFAGILEFMFSHVNGEVFRRTGDFLMLHAGAVVTPLGDGVILSANSGSGKSTLVVGLVQGGFAYLSDEVAAIDPVARRLYPYPKALNLKQGSFDLFPSLRARAGRTSFIGSQWHLRPDDIRPRAMGGPCDPRFVIFPHYQRGAATELVPISRGMAVHELMSNAFNLSMYRGRALALLADSLRSSHGYRLITGDLSEAVHAVASMTCGNGQPSSADSVGAVNLSSANG